MFLCSPGDGAEIEACEQSGADDVVTVGWDPGPGDFARKINYAVTVTSEPWILMAADDICFCPLWAENALECARVTGASVVGTQDWGNSRVLSGDHSTHPLVSRKYIEAFGTIDEPGKMLHEGYGHQFCDDELVATAKIRRAWTFCPGAELPHNHPDWGLAEDDDTYRKGRESLWVDKELYERRKDLWLRSRQA